MITGLTTAATAGAIFANNKEPIIFVASLIIPPLFSLLTSQLPDIDTPTSKISRKIPIAKIITNKTGQTLNILCMIVVMIAFFYFRPSPDDLLFKIGLFEAGFCITHLILAQCLKHRKLTHSLFSAAFISFIVLFPYYKFALNTYYLLCAIGIIAGYLAHIFYDLLTVDGEYLLYPLVIKPIRPFKWLKLKSGKYDAGGCVFSCITLVFALTYCLAK